MKPLGTTLGNRLSFELAKALQEQVPKNILRTVRAERAVITELWWEMFTVLLPLLQGLREENE